MTEATQRAGIESQVKMAAEGKAQSGPSTNAARRRRCSRWRAT